MKNQRVPCVPLITFDPYISLWSPADALHQADTIHWTGAAKRVEGHLTIDGVQYTVMGRSRGNALEQVGLEVKATTTRYRFEDAGVRLDIAFITPLLPDDLDMISRPCAYIDYTVQSIDGFAHTGELRFSFHAELCYDGTVPKAMIGDAHQYTEMDVAWMGRARQMPLSHSGDLIAIDWGYLYLAAGPDAGTRVDCDLRLSGPGTQLTSSFPFCTAAGPVSSGFVVGYDDIASINYFGDLKKGWWARNGASIIDALRDALAQHAELSARCDAFDERLQADAEAAAGPEYADLCALAWRQVIAGHKLIADNAGQPVFISKECNSSACAATVDVSYPSVPMLLVYAPALVRAMLRPVLAFSDMPVWTYDFAPHDVGRYPYVTGQTYGAEPHAPYEGTRINTVYPPYYLYPGSARPFRDEMQMPLEECGNMLLMAAALTLVEDDAGFVMPWFHLWERWARYLDAHGGDPREQLCTDDFAGHWAHNVNLSGKAVLGLEAYSILLGRAGRHAEAEQWHKRAEDMASEWQRRAAADGHTTLALGAIDTWSLKYNLIWDLLFQSNLFPQELLENEVRWYLSQRNTYGVPLDCRSSYTKSDWILWAASLTEDAEAARTLIGDVARFVRETPDRVPFSDWYDTRSARYVLFRNRTVQGGVFMPLLKRRMLSVDV